MTLEELARVAPFALPLAVPPWTLGCFRRRSITYADGAEDTQTAVYWLQSHGLTGDVRIPADRPAFAGRAGLADCSRDELAALARAEGGVADTRWAGGPMSWVNWAAFQPYDKWPEPGELRRIGGCMIEFAPSGAYVEDWRLQPGDSTLLVGLRLMAEQAPGEPARPRDGGLLVAGDHALLTLARRTPMPRAAPLDAQLLDAADLPAMAAAAFDSVTCLAHRRDEGFHVELSTNPFLEKRPLALGDFAPGETGRLVETLADGLKRSWRIDTLLPDASPGRLGTD